MANGNTKKTVLWAAAAFVVIAAVSIVFLIVKHKDAAVSFEASDRCYFSSFNRTFKNPDEYRIQSVDAYYDRSTERYYYECVHTFYDPQEDVWSDTIDEVNVLYSDQIEWIFCLSWDDLTGYEDRVQAFEAAKKNGVHQSYSEEKIKECLEKYRDE